MIRNSKKNCMRSRPNIDLYGTTGRDMYVNDKSLFGLDPQYCVKLYVVDKW